MATTKATMKAAATQAAMSLSPGSIDGAIARYARAIESGTVERLKEAYPGLTDAQQKLWENTWARSSKVKATVTDVVTQVDKDEAAANFRLTVSFDYPDGQPGSMEQRLLAELKKTPSGWQINKIR